MDDCYNTSARTGATPRSVIPKVRAAASERSRTRPRTHGPRSVIRTTTDLFVSRSVTRSLVPNGRRAYLMIIERNPQAVLDLLRKGAAGRRSSRTGGRAKPTRKAHKAA